MAAAAIPLIGAVAPSIINLIAGLVHKAAPAQETALGSGTGAVKFANVVQTTTAGLQAAATAGQIPAVPSASDIQTIVQAVVASMKLAGLLDSPPAGAVAAPAHTSPITLTSGQSVTITVK